MLGRPAEDSRLRLAKEQGSFRWAAGRETQPNKLKYKDLGIQAGSCSLHRQKDVIH
jgi:hypothetical protein